MEGGGGGMEGAEGDSFWNGQDGVRVTVLEDKSFSAVTTPMDFTNYSHSSTTYHFGKKNKLQYKSSSSLSPQIDGYLHVMPATSMPPIISSGGAGNIAAVKQYFSMEGTVKDIAEKTGFDYDELISGKYVLLIEPIAYFTYNGINLAMTATEAALYDQKVGGALMSKMGLLTHQNLPLAMFLERDDLGYPAYSGSITGIKSNATIISSLGLGSVRFKEIEEEKGSGEIEYRVNTDVITSFIVTAKEDTNPRNPASVTIRAGSYGSITFPVTMPEGASQYVWLKWHTPNKETSVTITAQKSGDITLNKTSITASIVDLNKYMPPNPTGRDRNDGFTIPTSMRNISRKTNANWHTYSCYLVEQIFDYSDLSARKQDKWFEIEIYYKTVTDYGDPLDPFDDYTYQVPDRVKMGKYFYEKHDYFASLNVSKAQTNPDEKVPTASGKTMKSGYGFNADVGTAVSSNGTATGVQTVVALFPEFKYDKYCRVLDAITNGFSAAFKFKENLYSMYKQRVHFTPIWYPDGTYKTQLVVFDAWTPDGMLVTDVSDTITIKGNVYDDWHIAPY